MGIFSYEIRRYLTEVAPMARGRMIDVGCGNKPYRALFPQVVEYVAMDLTSPEVDEHRPDAAGRRAMYDVEGTADDMPFQASSFDTVLCTQVIEHVPDPMRVFTEAFRVARPGAVLLLTAPLINPVHEAPYDFYRYTDFGLRELCRRSGWQVEHTAPMGGAWLSAGYLLLHGASLQAEQSHSSLKRLLWNTVGKRAYAFLKALDKRHLHADTPVGFLLVARKLK